MRRLPDDVLNAFDWDAEAAADPELRRLLTASAAAAEAHGSSLRETTRLEREYSEKHAEVHAYLANRSSRRQGEVRDALRAHEVRKSFRRPRSRR
jgi:hypothetical protein